MIRIVVADDHPFVRDALRAMLSRESDFDVVGEASDGREALDRIRELNPDILLLDLKMPKLDGLSALKVFQQWDTQTKVIVFTESEDTNDYVHAMRLGCSGIVLKSVVSASIIQIIRNVYGGESCLDLATTTEPEPQIAGEKAKASTRVIKAPDRSRLTMKELQITRLVARGFKNKQIAVNLSVNEQTVKNHLHSIFRKVDVSDRLQLAFYAVSKGLNLDPD